MSNLFLRTREWLLRPASTLPVAWFRIAVAAFCLARMWAIRDSILAVYGQYGFVQWAITRGSLYDVLPHLGDISLALSKLGVSADGAAYLVMASHAFSLLLLLFGIASRWVAAGAFCTNLLLMYAGGGLLYGMDYFTHIALTYCVIMPTGSQLACWPRRNQETSVSAGVTMKMLRLQLGIVYASSGIEKALGEQWWNGEAIWRAVTLPVFSQLDMTWLSQVPQLAMFMGWTVLLVEGAYPLFMSWRKTRALWLLLVVGMHFGIGLSMGMWLFASIMIILSVAAYGDTTVDALIGALTKAREAMASRHTSTEPASVGRTARTDWGDHARSLE